MLLSWRWNIIILIILEIARHIEAQTAQGCPPQEAILPCRCLTRGQEFQIWCSHSNLPRVLEGLRAVGQYLQQPIDELILENNRLLSLPGRTFVPLRVMRLMLRYNGLERVSNSWLNGLEDTLMELFIVEPELRSLPEDSLDRMDALEAVTVESNLMKRLPKFSGLPKLRYLQIESLSLVELSPRHFRVLPALEKFQIIGSSRLNRLEGGILQDLPKLKLVNISLCGISWMHPRAITRLPALTELWLVSNQITDAAMVGRSIRDLPALSTLHLDDNLIDRLGEAAFVDLPSLEKLYISHNRITELHHGAFHRVPKLRLLDLNRNLVKRVHPESFLQHSGSGLEELWLVENEISHVAELRSLLDALPRLTFLEMSHNNLEAIPFGALRGHPTLERLHLDHNKIHLVEREAFMAMPALRELRLKNNSLSDMLDAPLWNLPALKGLDLSGNYYRRIEPRLLENLPSLRRFDVSANELTHVDPSLFMVTPALEHVNISHNTLASLHPATFRHLLALYELDASHNRLVEFVPGLPRGIEYLHMSSNQIDNIPKSPSPDLDLPALKMLDLSANAIKLISPGSMKTLPQLRKFYIGKNLIQQIEDGSLDGLSRLEMLDLHDNRITQLHPNCFREMRELRELKLHRNHIDILRPELFLNTPSLKKLDISRNQLIEILPGTLETNKDIQVIDASHNSLSEFPPSIFGMKHLRILNLINNRLKSISSTILNSLMSLTELRLSQNLLREMKRGAFDNLQHLKLLLLDNNQLELIDSDAFHSLPKLKAIKLNNNQLRDIPNHAFNNLPSLQTAELQENQLQIIANDAFYRVPHLLMLNLSQNHLPGLDEAGLKSLLSLEMLDVSNNRLSRVASSSLDKMEWLVELRMDNNHICVVHGSPFNEMPRLRVLSMKNNKMMSFPEHAVQKLRGNLDVLDINGNPLACSCSMLWFRTWLQELSVTGPRCVDGTLLREMRITRQDCSLEEKQTEPVAPGCEAELLSVPGMYGTSQVFSQWMDLKDNSSNQVLGHDRLPPSPEESEYFYDEYVDYPYNESLFKNFTRKENVTLVPIVQQTQTSSHYIPGDTPTIYAGSSSKNKTKGPDIPKEISASPSSSGFTFFGVPLPQININRLWGGNNGRMSDIPPSAQRKVAIINNIPTQTIARGTRFPSQSDEEIINEHIGNRFPPTYPDIQHGGFVPLLPGSGGFTPIENPHMYTYNHTNTKEDLTTPPTLDTEFTGSKEVTNVLQASVIPEASAFSSHLGSSTHFPEETTPNSLEKIDFQPKYNDTYIPPKLAVAESGLALTRPDDSEEKNTNRTSIIVDTVKPIKPIENISKLVTSESPSTVLAPATHSELETANTGRFEDIFKEVVDNVSLPDTVTHSQETTESFTNMAKSTIEKVIMQLNHTTPKTNVLDGVIGSLLANDERQTEPPKKETTPTTLSAFLIPGGDQTQFTKSQGRPTITRVPSPHVSGSAPLQSNLDFTDDTASYADDKHIAIIESTTQKVENTQDMNWYYINYNKTNLEPYIGPGGRLMGSQSSKTTVHFAALVAFAAHLMYKL